VAIAQTGARKPNAKTETGAEPWRRRLDETADGAFFDALEAHAGAADEAGRTTAVMALRRRLGARARELLAAAIAECAAPRYRRGTAAAHALAVLNARLRAHEEEDKVADEDNAAETNGKPAPAAGAGLAGEAVGDAPARDAAYMAPDEAASRMACHIARLEPGPAATLRRRPVAGGGAQAFWQLLARYYRPEGAEERVEASGDLIQAIALLTPRGRSRQKRPAHDGRRSLGRALAECGVSELVLAQLLGATAERRRPLLLRCCRRLEASDNARLNCRELARLMLGTDERAAERCAADYWRARGRRQRQNEQAAAEAAAKDET